MRRRPVLALVAAGALVLAACGDDDDDAADDPTDEEAPEEEAPERADDADPDDVEPAETDPPADTEAPDDTEEPVVGEDWPDELVFILTPSREAGGLIETAEPLGDMLEERIGIPVEPFTPDDYAAVIVALETGDAHVAGGLGPQQMVRAEELAGARLILQSERHGDALYVTQWFTNDPDRFCGDEPVADDDGYLFCNGVLDATGPEDGPIGEEFVADVAGEPVAFVDIGSASGHLIPALQLFNLDIDPEDDIEPLFGGGHDGAVQLVYDGDATVGVSFNDARGILEDTHPDVGEQVVVFGWSGPIPNDGMAVSSTVPDDLAEAITDAFVDIAATEEGAELLDSLYQITGLQPVDSATYDVIREAEENLADLLD